MQGDIYLVDFREREQKDNLKANLIGLLFDRGFDIEKFPDGRITLLAEPEAILALRKILNAWHDLQPKGDKN
jgi:hypothetical protein